MFKKLLAGFEARTTLPVEIPELADALVNLGCQDVFIFSPQDTDPGKVRGVFYQYTTHSNAYAQPTLNTLVVFSKNVAPDWQRVICAKELIHVCDSAAAKTNTASEVDALVEKLLGPVSSEDYGLADFMASVDRLALYQALGLLFPMAAREVARAAIASQAATAKEIAEWVKLPGALVALVLSDEWPEVYKALSDI